MRKSVLLALAAVAAGGPAIAQQDVTNAPAENATRQGAVVAPAQNAPSEADLSGGIPIPNPGEMIVRVPVDAPADQSAEPAPASPAAAVAGAAAAPAAAAAPQGGGAPPTATS